MCHIALIYILDPEHRSGPYKFVETCVALKEDNLMKYTQCVTLIKDND